ncbi:succinylglutamate desuccinylase [Pantoea sp. Aalb]|uniref:succinylglutamate desuccinylase n=1 Tax=Pantoea sp. Aalb TaxID=2576762 RepID=UPI001321ABD0|nr:succinylglutamate desuccinylase [Pantoea sp. Aalb]MXP68001.1 succinylglutamate desuccinylase [Pantoea sp. Aalb]
MIFNVKEGKMNKILKKLLNLQLSKISFPIEIKVSYLGEGILQLLPSVGFKKAVILSAGIHGNETAPIELLARLIASLSKNTQRLNCALLIIFGNLPAIKLGKRYIHSDMNRLFFNHNQYEKLEKSINEVQCVNLLKEAVQKFLDNISLYDNIPCYHLDMHTTIRDSYFKQFALLPHNANSYNKSFFELLFSCKLNAIVQHNSPNGTFSYYLSKHFGVQSCTIELGKAKSFGLNNLTLFQSIEFAIKSLISGDNFIKEIKKIIRWFLVVESIIKTKDNFRLNLKPEIKNFTQLKPGYIIAYDDNHIWRINNDAPWILFPNSDVAFGLRACLLLRSTTIPYFTL